MATAQDSNITAVYQQLDAAIRDATHTILSQLTQHLARSDLIQDTFEYRSSSNGGAVDQLVEQLVKLELGPIFQQLDEDNHQAILEAVRGEVAGQVSSELSSAVMALQDHITAITVRRAAVIIKAVTVGVRAVEVDQQEEATAVKRTRLAVHNQAVAAALDDIGDQARAAADKICPATT